MAWRAFVCWILGIMVLWNDRSSDFDFRFKIRGQQSHHADLVLINVSKTDLIESASLRRNSVDFRDLEDRLDLSFWDPKLWSSLIAQIEKQNPRIIGAAFHFPAGLSLLGLDPQQRQTLLSQKMLWASPPNSQNNSASLFIGVNTALTNPFDLRADEDGLLRRFFPADLGAVTFLEKLTQIKNTQSEPKPMNFRGPQNNWPEYGVGEILNNQVPAEAFKNKIVIIGPASSTGLMVLTPFGPMTRARALATQADNQLSQSWIRQAPMGVYALALLLLLLICVFPLVYFPQSISFVVLLGLATSVLAVSAWVFDVFYIWIPVFAPLVQMTATSIVFLGYQADRYGRENFLLEKQSEAQGELEKLKSNFVSLISHDLKTPIAKIQAVVDRLSVKPEAQAVLPDLQQLRLYSEELHRYIKSILQLMQVESREFRLNMEIGDVNECLQQAISQVQALADSKDIQVTSELETLFSFEADFTLLREVFINVLENAVKYSEPKTKISVKSFETQDLIVVRITDTGCGISKEELPKIWGKFVRGHDQDFKTKGTGLGLYLVKYFVELHGGQVEIVSEVGQGTQVDLKLPLDSEPTKV